MAFRVAAGLRAVALLSLCIPSTLNGASDFYSRKSEDDICVPNMSFNLTRIEGKKVNHTWTVRINEYKTLTLHTRSTHPLIIEIPQFLSEMQSDHLVKLAKKKGLQKSTIQLERRAYMEYADFEKNERISVFEMHESIVHTFGLYFDKDDIVEMYTAIGLEHDDGEITKEELYKSTPDEMSQYLKSVVAKNPEKQARYSETARIYPGQRPDDVFITICKSLSKVFQLPVELLRQSELQVVKYRVKGRYHAHYDSSAREDSELPCCTLSQFEGCTPCRFLTAVFYLNEVAKGGETAFLLANNATVKEEDLVTEHNKCQGLRVLPEKGKAVIWYNHFVDPDTGWLGEMDTTTLHGGCTVLKGEKWIANLWVRLTNKEADLYKLCSLVPR